VSKVGGESDHVATDAIMITRRMHEDLVGKVEPQVMEPWTKFVFWPSNCRGEDKPMENSADRIAVKLAAFNGNENKGTGVRLTKPAHKIIFKPLFRSGVQGKQAALSKL
jgi:hypothetical protein